MRKLRTLAPAAVALAVVVALAPLTACGGEQEASPPDAAQPTEQAPQAVETAAAQEPTEGGDFWADIPVYPNAGPAEELPTAASQAKQMGEYRTVEFRHWETGADVGTVADFYLEEMPANGWTNVLKMDFGRPESAMSSWVKRDGDVAANVSVGRDASGTIFISIMRAEGAG